MVLDLQWLRPKVETMSFWTKSSRVHLTVQEPQVSPIGLFQSDQRPPPQ
ncbi:hypothetical protein [Enterobacter phage 03_vB_Eclo_IJM]|nr:hypothetical protein [Enterobacter phage 03_vB_Eclo_IJM]